MFVNLLLKLNSSSTSKVLSLNINILFGLSSDKMKIKLDCSKGSICLILNGITKINNIKPLLGNDLYRNIKKLFYSFIRTLSRLDVSKIVSNLIRDQKSHLII